MRLRLLSVAAIAAGLILLGQFGRLAEAEPDAQDPTTMPIEYRPGAYMPPGFPLEGSVKLLSTPVVQAGERHRIRVEYTVGEAGVRQGEALDIWKHFTSDVEGFQVDDPNKAAYLAVETTAPGATLRARAYTNSVQRNTRVYSRIARPPARCWNPDRSGPVTRCTSISAVHGGFACSIMQRTSSTFES